MPITRGDISDDVLVTGYKRLRPPVPRAKTTGVKSVTTKSLNVPLARAASVDARPRHAQRSAISDGSPDRARTERKQSSKAEKRSERNRALLARDNWLLKRGHTMTYVCVFLFTLTLYFRPYELFPALSGLSSLAFVLAIATLLIYLPTQFATEGNVTALTTEVKCVLVLAGWALLTIPIAKNPGLAWETFIDLFSKVVLMFIIMVNTLRTRARIKGLIWLAIGVGLMLTYQAIDLYQKGEFKTEGYRVSLDFGGMFGNPNDLAMHLAIVSPLAIALGLSSRNFLVKAAYFGAAGAMIVGDMVTQSRGGFLGLMAAAGVLGWKLGRRKRLKALMILLLFAGSFLAFSPNNYGIRILSIFDTSLDPVGSSSQRTELLKRSILVTLRNPQGIGIGNFPEVGQRSQQSHNSYTQVSSELGWLCFAAYLILLFSPFRKLGMVERELSYTNEHSWYYYMAIGIQASLAAYMVASFFGSVAYQWFAYYPIAFAVCLRRLYSNDAANETQNTGGSLPSSI